MSIQSVDWVGHVPDAIVGLLAAAATWRAQRAKMSADANAVQLSQWKALADQWKIEIEDCRAERDKQRIELSKMRTEIVALQKVHSGEFPEPADIERQLRGKVKE